MPLQLMEQVKDTDYYPIRMLKSHDNDEVYLAERRLPSGGDLVAIRVLQIADDPQLKKIIDDFEAEMQEIKSLSEYQHHILQPLYWKLDGTQLMVVMPYCCEGSLDDWMDSHEEGGHLSPAQVKSIISQIAEALQSAHAHQQGIVHGNVKPSQILVYAHSKGLDLQLTGFGVAELRAKLAAKTGPFLTEAGGYRAPEQEKGEEPPQPATDQYALALIAYKLITGHLPTKKAIANLEKQDTGVHLPQSTSSTETQLDLENPYFVKVFRQALAHDPEDRYHSITDFSNAFAMGTKSQVKLGEMLKTGVVFWFLLTVFLSFVAGVVLNAVNMLPAFVVSIASSLGSFFVTFWGFVSGIVAGAGAAYLKRSWKNTRKPIVVATIISVITVALLLVLDLRLSALTDPYTHQATISYQDTLTAMDPDWQATNNNGTCTFQNGALVVTELRPEEVVKGKKLAWFAHCVAQAQNFGNFVYEVQMRVIGGNCGGITLRQNLQDGDYYLFEICTDGTYRFSVYTTQNSNPVQVVSSAKNSPFIHLGLNIVAVVARGTTFSLEANGHTLDSFTDSTYSDGHIGVIADLGSEVAFNNAKVWKF